MEVYPDSDLQGTYKYGTDTETSESFLRIIRQTIISFTFLTAKISDNSRSEIKKS